MLCVLVIRLLEGWENAVLVYNFTYGCAAHAYSLTWRTHTHTPRSPQLYIYIYIQTNHTIYIHLLSRERHVVGTLLYGRRHWHCGLRFGCRWMSHHTTDESHMRCFAITHKHTHTHSRSQTHSKHAHTITHTRNPHSRHTNTCDDVDIDSLRDALCLYGVSKVKFLCWTVCCAAACWLLVAGRIYTVRARLYALCVCVVASPKIQPSQIHFGLRRCARNLRSQNAQQSTMMMLLLFASCCWWCLACRGSVYIVIFMQHFFLDDARRSSILLLLYYIQIISTFVEQSQKPRCANQAMPHGALSIIISLCVQCRQPRARETTNRVCRLNNSNCIVYDNAIYRRPPLGVWNDPTITQICLPRRFLQTKHDSQMILCTYIYMIWYGSRADPRIQGALWGE